MSTYKDDYEKENDAEGYRFTFFILHNIISAIMFFFFAFWLGLFNQQENQISDIFSPDLYNLIFWVFGLSVITAILARYISYWILKGLYKGLFKKRTFPSLKAFFRGINGISFAFFVSTLISAVIFAFGLTTVFQDILFNQDTFFAAVMTYLILEIAVYGISRLFSTYIIRKM